MIEVQQPEKIYVKSMKAPNSGELKTGLLLSKQVTQQHEIGSDQALSSPEPIGPGMQMSESGKKSRVSRAERAARKAELTSSGVKK